MPEESRRESKPKESKLDITDRLIARRGGFAAVAFLVAAAALAPSASGQGRGAYTPSKGWDGHADLTGIWEAFGAPAGDSIEARNAAWGIRATLGSVTDPPGGLLPYKPEAVAKRNANFKNRAQLDSTNKCYMPGVPRLMYMGYPFQIFQSSKFVIVASEYMHTYRTIYVDGSKHLDSVDFYDGDSRGHWEGDTLVVDVTNFNDQTWFDKAGNYHSDALHVVERFTRTSADTMTYTASVEDPKVFTRAFTITVPMFRHTETNARLLEYECQSYREDEASGNPR
jgi:hypothetical protein